MAGIIQRIAPSTSLPMRPQATAPARVKSKAAAILPDLLLSMMGLLAIALLACCSYYR